MTDLSAKVLTLRYNPQALRPWPESQWRQQYMKFIMGAVKLRKKMDKVGRLVRRHLAKKDEGSK